MIFAIYKYKSYHNDNKEEWPIQPPTQEVWNKMVNLEHNYYIEHPKLRCPKNIKAVELNSNHPYWYRQSRDKSIKFWRSVLKQCAICEKDPTRTKYLFNAGASVSRIKNEAKLNIEKLRNNNF